MEISGLMSLGLFLGMTHAMDADHIAAVSAMWNLSGRQAWINAAGALLGRWSWYCAFLALCAVLLSTGQALSEQKQALLELSASLLILYLGVQLIWQMYRRRIHIHIHEHDGKHHLHMHSHLNDHPKPNATIPHDELAPRWVWDYLQLLLLCRCRLPAREALFWQSVFGDNSLSLPVDWWHNCRSMPCKAGRLLNVVPSVNHHPE
jgi:ABC-type nickel/cobalt efflux system permease component RcnA